MTKFYEFIKPHYFVVQSFALIVAYFATGKLGMFLAVPPGYATAIYPPPGIALAGILLWGYRAWFGVFLGSFLLNLSIAESHAPITTYLPVLIAFIIAISAVLQAIVGAYLIKRFADFPNPLANEKNVFTFMFYGGILSTLVNSTISVSTLALMNQVPSANFLTNWSTWWMGDAIGVFIFAPLMLVWLYPEKVYFRHRKLAISSTIVAAFSLTVILVAFEADREIKHLKMEFDKDAYALNVALNKSVTGHLSVLRSLESFYNASESISRDEFHDFVAQVLIDFKDIQALGWNPIVTNAQREMFEKSMRKEGFSNFEINDRDVNNNVIRATHREFYVPATFIEPLENKNELALGYDVNANPIRHEAIEAAQDTGEITTTSKITLVQNNEAGVLIFVPIYKNHLPHQNLQERRQNILGYALAVLRINDIFTIGLSHTHFENLHLQLFDENAPTQVQHLLFSNQTTPFVLRETGLFGRNISLKSSALIQMGNRQWRFDITPTQDYFANHHSDNLWLILLAGLILTSSVGLFVMVLTGREMVFQKLLDERTQALGESENNLNRTKEHLENVLSSATEFSIIATDKNGLITVFNRGAELMLGYSDEEMIGKQTPTIIHSESEMMQRANELSDELQKPISGFQVFCEKPNQFGQETREWSYIRKDKTSFPLLLTVTAIKDKKGNVTGYLGIGVDLTQRKLIEAELKQSENRFRSIIEHSPIPFALNDDDQNVIFLNRAFTETFGYDLNDIPKLDVWWNKAYPDENYRKWVIETWRHTLTIARQENTPFPPLELNVICKDGSQKIMMASASMLSEAVNYHLVTLYDMTERITAFEKLKKSEQKLQLLTSLIEGSQDPFYVLDVSDNFRMVFANKATCKHYGLPKETLLTMRVPDWDPDVDLEQLFALLPTLRKEKHISLTTRHYTADGIVPVEVSINYIKNEEGEFTFGYIADLRPRLQLEATMREAKERAESLAKSKSEFLANMSHEIRTPMTAIIGLSQLALNKEMPNDVRDSLTKVHQSAHSLLGILNDVLDFSKLEAGKLKLENAPFNLVVIFQQLHNLFSVAAKSKNLEFIISAEYNVPNELIGDSLRIQQIISNLLGNAIKFTETGKVEFFVKQIENRGEATVLRFSVQDTGIGIKKENQDNLFNAFNQADNSITRRFGGTGLGLTISRDLLHLMDSDFHIDSVEGKGTTIYFDLLLALPKTEKRNFEPENSSPVNQEGSLQERLAELSKSLVGTQILLAEDNSLNQEIVSSFLNLSGIEVDIADNGIMALELLKSNAYDAILMDIHMPEMDGLQATKAIREQAKYANLPIIALTAGVTTEEQEKCLSMGMTDFVEKPVNPEILLQTLSRCVKAI